MHGSHQRSLRHNHRYSCAQGTVQETCQSLPTTLEEAPAHVHFCPLHTISPKNRPCRQKGFKTQLECSNCRRIVSERGWVLKELSIYSAAYCYKHLKKLLHPKRKDKSLLLWKLGGFQGCWCASKRSRARIDNHGRNDRKNLQAPEDHLRNICTCLINQVLLPGPHNLGRQSVCHSYHLLAPTRTMSRTAYSYMQSE